MTLLITYAVVAVVVSFVCSLMESVLLSTSPAFIELSIKNKRKCGHLLKKHRDNIEKPLAAILSLNTIANMVGATGVGAQVQTLFGNSALTMASALLTIVILIFSEIIPKTLGAVYWKKLAPFCSYFINGLIYALYPFVLLARGVSNLMGKNKNKHVTREEMIMTAEISATEGSIEHKEKNIIQNLLMLSNIPVHEVMTPRSVITAYDATSKVDDVVSDAKKVRFSRIPIYKDTLDNVVGVIHRHKLLDAVSNDLEETTLDKFMTDLHSVPEEISVAAVLDQFLKRKEHMFLVISEYGSTVGIVTLEDAIETLLGVEIVDEFDSVEDMQAYALEKWKERKTKLHNDKA